MLAAVNAAVVLYDRYLLAIEMKMRVRHVANRLKQVIFTPYEKLLNGDSPNLRTQNINTSPASNNFCSGSRAHILAASKLSPPPHAGGSEHRAAVDAEGRRPRESPLGAARQRGHHHGEAGPGTGSCYHRIHFMHYCISPICATFKMR